MSRKKTDLGALPRTSCIAGMAYGQDSDVAVDADLLRRLDVSPVSGPRANMLQALELLFGERLFEDA